MTLLQIIENIKQHFPDVGRKQMVIDINSVYFKFAHETRLLKKSADLTIATNTVAYTLATEFTDMDGELITKIEYKDSGGDLVDDTDTLKHEINTGVITFYDYYGDVISSVTTDHIASATFHYVYVPTVLEDDSDEPLIDTQYHDALVYGVLTKYYSTFPTVMVVQDQVIRQVNLNLANHFRGMYKELEISGRRKANEYAPLTSATRADDF